MKGDVGYKIKTIVNKEKPIKEFIIRKTNDMTYDPRKSAVILTKDAIYVAQDVSTPFIETIYDNKSGDDNNEPENIKEIRNPSIQESDVQNQSTDTDINYNIESAIEQDSLLVSNVLKTDEVVQSHSNDVVDIKPEKSYIINNDDDVEFDNKKFNYLHVSEDPVVAQTYVFDFLESVMPSRTFLKEKHPMMKFVDNIYRRHDYSSMFYAPSLSNTRTLRWLALMRVILVGLFVDTTLFLVFFPTDSFCTPFTTRETCIIEQNSATGRPTCVWTSTGTDLSGAEGTGTCGTRQPPSSVTFTIVLALLTLIVGVPIELMINFVMMAICTKRPDLREW
eukprot:CAMPEP_0196768562 /NCGR_PEP_ID=MMETSP1095-20130614/42917_1 /TAXON_ID=96789 ORGANISM="Chromulina nebulosa, Strain UTEXLB2642" /NCGR_SAMPLE_ID=MMETSP1095 /ASSEMBLY_ACC=CAM_ASM_000446 /LENGTH=334 /DNA_ID=CAMNT_0042138367 /DNA_START=1124 /DNA_END=2125 /DNA_ORIENTATION=-